jgi:hypothetical protein
MKPTQRPAASPVQRPAAGVARRSSRVRTLVACAIAGAAFGTGAQAFAQDQVWLKDRRYTEGPGLRVGDFEFHPGIAAEFGYDTNYLRRADSDGGDGSLRLRITPSLSVSTIGPQRNEGTTTPNTPPPDVEFRGTAAVTYNEFFGVTGIAKDSVSQARNITGNLNLNLGIRPRHEWSGTLYAGVARVAQPSETGAFGAFQGAFDRDVPTGGAELAWTPGSGLLDWRLGYRFTGTLFETVTGLTNLEHQIQTRGRWRFLPRTAMLYDFRMGFINYPNPTGLGGGSKTGSHPMRTLLGVNGLITPSFGLLAMVGWGSSFYDATPRTAAHDFDSIIGQAEVKWYITPNPQAEPNAATLSVSSLSVGFLRDFQDSAIGTYVERDRAYANLSYFFGGRVLVVVDGGVGPMVYPRIESVSGVTQNTPSFTDIRYDASVFGEYRLKDYLGINATVRYSGNASNTSLHFTDKTGPITDSLQWQAFEAYLGARIVM